MVYLNKVSICDFVLKQYEIITKNKMISKIWMSWFSFSLIMHVDLLGMLIICSQLLCPREDSP